MPLAPGSGGDGGVGAELSPCGCGAVIYPRVRRSARGASLRAVPREHGTEELQRGKKKSLEPERPKISVVAGMRGAGTGRGDAAKGGGEQGGEASLFAPGYGNNFPEKQRGKGHFASSMVRSEGHTGVSPGHTPPPGSRTECGCSQHGGGLGVVLAPLGARTQRAEGTRSDG